MASSEISAGTPALVRLGELAEGEGGGKAAGLRALLNAGLEVPAGPGDTRAFTRHRGGPRRGPQPHRSRPLGEFDYPARDDQFFTRANIGEMMPGAVTPLTMNVFGDAVDFCIRYFYRTTGSLTLTTRNERFVVSFGGHLFLNLNQMFLMADRVLGTTRKTFEQNLLGHPPDDGPAAVTGIMSALANGDIVEIDGRRGTMTVIERATGT